MSGLTLVFQYPTTQIHANTAAVFAGGCLLDMGIYPIAMAWLFLRQDPDSQSVWHHKADNGGDDDVVILNRYGDDRATAQLCSSFRCKLNNYLSLIGDKGSITIADYWGGERGQTLSWRRMC